MTNEDIKNLVGWLQAIHKELQETKGMVSDTRDKANLIPEIRQFVSRETRGSGEIDHKIDETRNRLEARVDHLEQQINELKSILTDVRNKVDRIKT